MTSVKDLENEKVEELEEEVGKKRNNKRYKSMEKKRRHI